MDYIIPPPEIEEMMKKIRPWEIGAGIFKENTPPEIIEMDKKVMDFYSKALDGDM